MAKSKSEELKEKRIRNTHFSNFIKEKTIRDKVKFALLEEYRRGHFYSVTPNLFESNDEKDISDFELLKQTYLLSKDDNQAIPDGLFNLDDPAEINLLLNNLSQKLRHGVIIDFSFIPKGKFTPNELMILERFKNFNEKNKEKKQWRYSEAIHGFQNGKRIGKSKTRTDIVDEEKDYVEVNPGRRIRIRNNSEEYKEYDTRFLDIDGFGFGGIEYEDVYKRKFIELGFIKDTTRDPNEELTIADINRELEKALEGFNSHSITLLKMYEALFRSIYEREFKQIELDTTYMSNDKLNSILKQQFYTFRVYDGIINGEQTERQQEILKKQKAFIESALVSLSMTGCLDELVRMENRNIKSLNEILPPECQFEELDNTMIFDDLVFLSLKNQSGIIDLYTFGRHFTNKLAHNYIDYAYAILKMNSISDNDYQVFKESEFYFYIEEVYDALGNGTNIDEKKLDKMLSEVMPNKRERTQRIEILKKILNNGTDQTAALEKAKNNIKGKLESDDCFAKYRICKYENITEFYYTTINTLKNMQKQYYDTVKAQTGNSRISPESFEKIFGQVLEGTIKKENFTEFKREEVVKKGRTRTIYLIDEIQAFVNSFKKSRFVTSSEDVLKRIVGTLEKVEEIFSAKQFFTDALIAIADKNPELIRLEHLREIDEDTNTGGVFDVILPGRIQVFGGHYKEGEFDQTDLRITGLPSVNEDVSACFSTDDKRASSLNVFIPLINRLTDEQTKEFKNLLTTINHLEGNLTLTDEQAKLLQGYDKLKALKASSPESYESMKVRIALGAGIDEYKKMYAVELQQAASKEKQDESTNAICTLTTFQKSTANLIISEISSGRSMQDVINDIGTVNAAILEYVQTKIKEESFYQAQPDEIKAELLKLETDREYETGEQKE